MLRPGKKQTEILQQFFLCLGIFLLLWSPLELFMRLSGRDITPLFPQVVTISGSCILASAMAIFHYYWLYNGYFTKKRYLAYLALSICLIILMLLPDSVLFRLQTGRNAFSSDGTLHLLRIIMMRVIVVYTPLAIFYVLIRRKALMRKKVEMLQRQ